MAELGTVGVGLVKSVEQIGDNIGVGVLVYGDARRGVGAVDNGDAAGYLRLAIPVSSRACLR